MPEKIMEHDLDAYEDDEYDEDGNVIPPADTVCPGCQHEYDEIDFEYQICHICRFNNNKRKNK